MSEGSTELQADMRAQWDSTLLHVFPEHVEAIKLGWELTELLSNRRDRSEKETIHRFLHRQVAVVGDSAKGIRIQSRDGDFTCFRAYFRVVIYPGDPPKPPHCVHYEVCALGEVHAIVPEFGQVGLFVPADRYVIFQTF